jgi:hypothetical protein
MQGCLVGTHCDCKHDSRGAAAHRNKLCLGKHRAGLILLALSAPVYLWTFASSSSHSPRFVAPARWSSTRQKSASPPTACKPQKGIRQSRVHWVEGPHGAGWWVESGRLQSNEPVYTTTKRTGSPATNCVLSCATSLLAAFGGSGLCWLLTVAAVYGRLRETTRLQRLRNLVAWSFRCACRSGTSGRGSRQSKRSLCSQYRVLALIYDHASDCTFAFDGVLNAR